jgi:hypothetical protein
LTPEQKIKHAILERAREDDNIAYDAEITADNVDALYQKLEDDQLHWDYVSEMRGRGVDTGLKCEWSRHYESKAIAAKMPDGSWVGWTYWYGGGKHSEPEAIDWMNEAYDLDCKEEEKMLVVRTFTLKEAA